VQQHNHTLCVGRDRKEVDTSAILVHHFHRCGIKLKLVCAFEVTFVLANTMCLSLICNGFGETLGLFHVL